MRDGLRLNYGFFGQVVGGRFVGEVAGKDDLAAFLVEFGEFGGFVEKGAFDVRKFV